MFVYRGSVCGRGRLRNQQAAVHRVVASEQRFYFFSLLFSSFPHQVGAIGNGNGVSLLRAERQCQCLAADADAGNRTYGRNTGRLKLEEGYPVAPEPRQSAFADTVRVLADGAVGVRSYPVLSVHGSTCREGWRHCRMAPDRPQRAVARVSGPTRAVGDLLRALLVPNPSSSPMRSRRGRRAA